MRRCNFTAHYSCPSQSQDELETFSANLGMMLENLEEKGFFQRFLADFNTKSLSFKDSIIESIISHLDYLS